MREQLEILLVMSAGEAVAAVRAELEGARLNPTIRRVETAGDLSAGLNEGRWDVVLAADDLAAVPLPDLLRLVQARDPDLPVIILAATSGEEAAVEAIKAGAQDYVLRGALARLDVAVRREVQAGAARRARRRTERRLEHLALHDGLTELPNRRLFEDRLANGVRVATRDRHGLALMVMDLDGFKPVNDTFGHAAGDLLLRLVGVRLRDALRESDTVARLGGDEFGVLVPKLETRGIVPPALIDRILGAFSTPFSIEGAEVKVGASLGIATFPEHGRDGDTLMRHADIAMYVAKRAKSGHAVYDAAGDQYSRDRMSLMEDLRNAIDRAQLVLHFQPVVELRTGACRDVEALVRWQHPQRGLIPPNEFLPMFERLRLMRNLGDWAIGAALRQCREWRAAGIELDVTVNLAAQNLADAEFTSGVQAAIERAGTPGRWLFLEMPEGVIMSDPERSARTIDELRIMGIRFAIDDFGTGFSSLAYLDKLRVDRLKVDRSFVSGTGPAHRPAIVRAAAEIGRVLGFAVLAEGVEDAEACERVAAQGCELGQGYFFAPPMPADKVAAWLAAHPPRPEAAATLGR